MEYQESSASVPDGVIMTSFALKLEIEVPADDQEP